MWLNRSGKNMVGEWVIAWVNDSREEYKREKLREASEGGFRWVDLEAADHVDSDSLGGGDDDDDASSDGGPITVQHRIPRRRPITSEDTMNETFKPKQPTAPPEDDDEDDNDAHSAASIHSDDGSSHVAMSIHSDDDGSHCSHVLSDCGSDTSDEETLVKQRLLTPTPPPLRQVHAVINAHAQQTIRVDVEPRLKTSHSVETETSTGKCYRLSEVNQGKGAQF